MTRSQWLAVGGVVLIAAAAATAPVTRLAESWAHARITRALAERFESEVTLEGLTLGWFPSLSASGTGLTLRYRGRRDQPPLIHLRHFTARAGWWSLPIRRIDAVVVEGLEINIPPGRGADMPKLGKASGPDRQSPDDRSTVSIRHLAAENARLTILPKTDGKNPHVFDIFRLDMADVRLDAPSAFKATLTNPIPFGSIESQGAFGPWVSDEPGQTPVAGTFVFNADLGTIKGIAGALTSHGRFSGPLARIEAAGSTRTPDFRIPKLRAAALPLETEFEAVIDGTSGDVELTRVMSELGASAILARGRVVGMNGIKGKRVVLDVTSDDSHIEDYLRLTVPVEPPLMTGVVTLTTSFDLPPGEADVVDRLELDGRVHLATARFTRAAIQDKVDELSRRGRGRPEDDRVDDVASNIDTTFALKDGTLRLRRLTYTVTGATIRLGGAYHLESRAMDFAGEALLDASVSNTQRGFKHYLLKPFDPLFRRKGAGTRLAIDVSGTVDRPRFGVAVGRTLLGRK
ncbi:MAG: hypothetical protein IT180_11610 [Acidobacteria bacterium]|nr:hypothetical protein [Acidobacteriota bacterium]